MISVVLRLAAPELDLDSCLAWLPEDGLEQTWRAGLSQTGRPTPTTSGFTLLLVEGDDPAAVAQSACAALSSVAAKVSALVRNGATGELDFALFVGPEASVSVRLNAELLKAASEVGLDINVCAYPCAD